jgi:uncharacterized protein involved in exopolysaccharide biosynthesis
MNNFNKENSYYEKLVDIDFLKLINIFWKEKLMIFSITLTFSIISVFYSLSLPNIYTSHSIIKLQNNLSQNISSSSQYSSILSIAGLNSKDDNPNYLFIELVKSKNLLTQILKIEDFKQKIYAADSYNLIDGTIRYSDNIYQEDKKWIRKVSTPLKPEPSVQEVQEVYLKNLVIDFDKSTGFITLSYSHVSPIFAKEFLETIISYTDSIIKNKSKKESEDSILFLKNMLQSSKESELRATISKLIEAQLEIFMFSSINDYYLVRFIDQPFIPIKKSGPFRALICIFGFLIGFALSIFYVLIRRSISS